MAENETLPSVRYWGPQAEDDVDPNEVAATLLARINERAKARKSAMQDASNRPLVSPNMANGDVKGKKKNKAKSKGKVDINSFDAFSKDDMNTSLSADNVSGEQIANGDVSETIKKKIKADKHNVSFTKEAGGEENFAHDTDIESTPRRKKKKSKEGIETENKEIPNDEAQDSIKEPTPKKKKKKSTIVGEIQDNGIPNGEAEHISVETTPRKKKKKSTVDVENKDIGEVESISETPHSEKKKFRNRTESVCNEAAETQNSGNNNVNTEVEESGKKRKEKRKRKGSENANDTFVATGNEDSEILNGGVGNMNESRQSEKKKKFRNRTESLSSEVGGMRDNRSNDLKAKVENGGNKKKEKRKRANSESAVNSIKMKGKDAATVKKPNAQNLELSNMTVNGRAPPNKKARGNEKDIRNKEKGKGAQGNNTKGETEYEGFTMLREVIRDNRTKVERVLPYWMSNPVKIDTDINKEKVPVDSMLGLDATLKSTLQKNKIEFFFPVQKYIIPELLSSATSMTMRYRPRDVCVSAPTGSGKTLAYVLPLIQALATRRVRRIRALVILPVRELAIQVHKVFTPYAKVKGLKVGLACGEITFAREQKSLVNCDYAGYHSLVDILVATPGRLADHLSFTKGFDLSDLRYLILDEADHLLKMDGGTCIERIEQSIKDFLGVPRNAVLEMQAPNMFQFPKPTLQRLLFSATLTSNPEELKVVPLYRPKLFAICSDTGAGTKANEVKKYTRPDTLTEEFTVIEESVKPLVVHHLVQSRGWNKVLIFTNSIESTHKLAVLLSFMAKEKTVVEFSKLINKRKRISILKDFFLGKINILVSSDAMARGLDIPNIDNVICYDVTSTKTYIHRIGRTARAGASGTAVSLVPKDKIRTFKRSGGKAKEFSIPTEELEPYESMYVGALEKLKESLETEKQKEWEKVQKANMPRRGNWKGQGHKGARASLYNRENRETNK